MRKKIKQRKYIVLALAIFVGLFVGLLIIPNIKNILTPQKKSTVEVIAPGAINVPITSEQVLNEKNWQQYSSQDYDLTFKYPDKFVTNVFNEPEQDISLFGGLDFGRIKMPKQTLYENDLASLGYTISVRIDRARTLKEALAETDIYKDREGYSKKEIKVLGMKAYQYDGVGLDSYQTRIFFERDKIVYLFMLARYTKEGELITEGEQVFKKMVDTIQFSPKK